MQHNLSTSDSHLDNLALLVLQDCEPNERLDQITREAAALFSVPIAMINLVTSKEICFKACVGLNRGDKLDKSGMFCSRAAEQDEPLVVKDATADNFFRHTHLVTGPLAIRSYAGKSLRAPDGTKIGTMCLFDTKPRSYSRHQLDALCALAEQAESQLHAILNGQLLSAQV